MPAPARSIPSIQGGMFQTVGNRKPASAREKSRAAPPLSITQPDQSFKASLMRP